MEEEVIQYMLKEYITENTLSWVPVITVLVRQEEEAHVFDCEPDIHSETLSQKNKIKQSKAHPEDVPKVWRSGQCVLPEPYDQHVDSQGHLAAQHRP
jgi:hypothetical protein